MNKPFIVEFENLELRPLVRNDIQKLREWRNDKASTRFLRPIGYITQEMQKRWYENYLNDSNIITFAIQEKEKLNCLVGSCSLYDFKEGVAEFGKIQVGDERAHGCGIGRKATVMILKVAFEELNIQKIVAEVHQQNIAAQKSYSLAGFKKIGCKESCVGGYEDIIEIDRDTLIAFNSFYNNIKITDQF